MNTESLTKLFNAVWQDAQAPGRKSGKTGAAAVRKVRLFLDNLEDRSLMSTSLPTLPAPLVTSSVQLGTLADPNRGTVIDSFAPSLAISPTNPLLMAEVHATTLGLAGNFSLDGGNSWNPINGAGGGFAVSDPAGYSTLRDPAIDPVATQNFSFKVAESPQVAFDRTGALHVVDTEHSTDYASGAIVYRKFTFAGTTATQSSTTKLYSWYTNDATLLQDPAYNPTIAIDTAAATFTDPTSGAVFTDPSAGQQFTYSTTLTAGLGATGAAPPATTTGTVSVVDNTLAPNGTFALTVDGEVMQATKTAGSTTSFTVTRAANSPAHASGAVAGAGLSALNSPKGVYVAWNTNMRQPDGAPVPTVSKIHMKASGNGGTTFTDQEIVAAGGDFGAPRIAFSQTTQLSTLAAALTAGATSLTIPAAIANFNPTTNATVDNAKNNFLVQIDNEKLNVTAGANGTTWTVTRGVAGTAAAAHAANAPVIVLGGQLQFYFESRGQLNQTTTSLQTIVKDVSRADAGVALAPVAAAQTFAGTGGAIGDALPNSGATTTLANSGGLDSTQTNVFVPVGYSAGFNQQNSSGQYVATFTIESESFRITNVTNGSTTNASVPAAPVNAANPNDPYYTINVVSNAAFQVGDLIQIDNEKMTVTGKTGSGVLTVTRAAGGTTAAAHAANVQVQNLTNTLFTVVRGTNYSPTNTAAPHSQGQTLTLTTGGDVPIKTVFDNTVTITNGNLSSILDLDLTLNIFHDHVDELQIEIAPPVPAGSPAGTQPTYVTLVYNAIDGTGAATGRGIDAGGKDLGTVRFGSGAFVRFNDVGLVLNDDADRSISTVSGAGGAGVSPFVAHFRPEANSLKALVAGKSPAALNGVWKLRITDYKTETSTTPAGATTTPAQALRNWSLNFTGAVSTKGFGSESGVGIRTALPPALKGADLPLAGSIDSFYAFNADPSNANTTNTGGANANTAAAGTGLAFTKAGTHGLGTGLSLAVDSSQGSYSSYQGRIYMVYNGGVGRNDSTAYANLLGNDTNVYLVSSDDNGVTWSAPKQVNDDAASDNFSEGSRAQFTPSVSVDPLTGTVVVTYYDARYDAANVRTAVSVAVSNDGGATFSKTNYISPHKTATDFLTGKVVDLEPVGGNQPIAGVFGFGEHQGLAAYGGNIYSVFSSNTNGADASTGATTSIFTAKTVTAAGPRIVYGDSGAVSYTATTVQNGAVLSYNNSLTLSGREPYGLDGFVVQFDRPVDVSTFSTADVTVQFKNPNTGATSTVPLSQVVPLDTPSTPADAFGVRKVGIGTLATKFLVKLAATQSAVGTYSYAVGSQILDKMRNTNTPTLPGVSVLGNAMDQNANGVSGEGVKFTASATTTINNGGNPVAATDSTFGVTSSAAFPAGGGFTIQIDQEQLYVVSVAGTTWTVIRGFNNTNATAHADGSTLFGLNSPDQYANPNPLPVLGTAPITGTPFAAPYDLQTLPLIVPGLHVVRTSLPNGTAFVPSATTTLAADLLDDPTRMDAATTYFSLKVPASATGFPTGLVPFTIQIGGEQMRVTAVTPGTTTNTWSLERGTNNTSIPDEHGVGSVITYVPETLGLNSTVSAVDITFDRAVDPTGFVGTYNLNGLAGDQIAIIGPIGQITGTVTVAATPNVPAGLAGRVFRVSFPTQTLSGNYSVAIKPFVRDTDGNLIDNNLNAGVDVVRGTSDPANSPISRPVYASNTSVAIPANGSVTSTLSIADVFQIVQATKQYQFDGQVGTTIVAASGLSATATTIPLAANTQFQSLSGQGFPDTAVPFVIQIDSEQIQVTAVNGVGTSGPSFTVLRGFNNTTAATHANGATATLGQFATIEAELNINTSDIRGLTISLVSPDGKTITLANKVASTAAANAPHANFANTVFDDSATQPIQAALPPTAGPYTPQTPLSVLNGSSSAGTWRLVIKNTSSVPGTLTHWELRLPKTRPTNGLGESGGDRITASFRVFTLATTNPQSSKQWVAVGPVGNTADPVANGDNGGPVHALTVDPSDPSGNTVYAGASSGGVWRTTNFLTTDSAGPTWVPLTDFGETGGLNIGSIAVYGRNNDPSQTIILAATGNRSSTTQTGQTGSTGGANPNPTNTTGATGIGFLRSMDGGRTWDVLDSTVNTVNANGTGGLSAITAGSRDNAFFGTSGFKVVIDPNPLPGGGVVMYAALTDDIAAIRGSDNGGFWRSVNGGNTWTRVTAGSATDIALAPASRDNNGNLAVMFVAFHDSATTAGGVYRVIGSPTTASTLQRLDGGQTSTPRIDLNIGVNAQIPTAAPADSPSGAKGNIVLAFPQLVNDPLQDTFYQGWLYAAVSNADGSLNGLYVTKDFGLNWTQVTLPIYQPLNNSGTGGNPQVPDAVPGDGYSNGGTVGGYGTNNELRDTADPGLTYQTATATALVNQGQFQKAGNYATALTVDPANPRIVYFGGAGGLSRIDITKLDDPYATVFFNNNDPDGGKTTANTKDQGGAAIRDLTQPFGLLNPDDPMYPNDTPVTDYLNLYRNPANKFISPASLTFKNITQFNNDGTEASYATFGNNLPRANATKEYGTVSILNRGKDVHQILAVRDPLTGATRLMIADDNGVQVGLDDGKGNVITNVGFTQFATGNRSGTMQVNQLAAGATQPSSLAAQLAGALLYGTSSQTNALRSTAGVISTGDVRWNGYNNNGTVNSSTLVLGRVTGMAGVGTDATGSGQAYQFVFPSSVDSPPGVNTKFVPTDFFQVTPAAAAAISRVSGLVQAAPNQPFTSGDSPGTNQGQWSEFQGSNFAVNPIDPTTIIISSQTGNLFLTGGRFTGGTGVVWHQLTPVSLTNPDLTQASALAFGSLQTTNNTPSSLVYAGYQDGRMFVSANGGSSWTEISNGLDGLALLQVIPNPSPDSHEAYAITTQSVYYMKDSTAAGATWVKLNDAAAGVTTTTTGALSATATTVNVASGGTGAVNAPVGFPSATSAFPFVVQIDSEQILVTATTATRFTLTRGYNNTTPAAHASGAVVTLVNPLLGVFDPTTGAEKVAGLKGTVFGTAGNLLTRLSYLTSIQADWRYAIPDAVVQTKLAAAATASATSITVASAVGLPASTPFNLTIDAEQLTVTGVSGNVLTVLRGQKQTTAAAHSASAVVTPVAGTHPVLYVAGEGGVFRSRDKGATWTFYPNVSVDGAPSDGGYLPNAHVSQLNLVLGNVNTQSGFTDTTTGYNMLVATTYGRGDFAIRLDNDAIKQFVVAPNSGPRVTNLAPTVVSSGSQFSGFTLTFGGAVDPATFTASDITVTGPNGAVGVVSVVDATGGFPDNVYTVTFGTPQTAVGNYTVKVGPDVRDPSGNLMDQNQNNINGEAVGDVFTTTYAFAPNNPPTISAVANVVVAPGASTAALAFTVGDAETPAASLAVTASVTLQAGYTPTASPPTAAVGGSGANRTVTVTAPAGAHGPATVTLTVQDASGLQTSTTFTVTVDAPPVLPAITDPTVALHGSTPTVLALNATDPDGDPLTYAVTVNDPLFAVKTQYGLTALPNPAYTNSRGAGELYFQSTNGSNPGGTGYYLLLPNGDLRPYVNGSSSATTGPVVANVGTAVYANPSLLTNSTAVPQVQVSNPLNDFKVRYGLDTAAMYTNSRGYQEKYLLSSNNSNPGAGGNYFILTSSNTLLALDGQANPTKGRLVADFTALGLGDVYNNPALLTAAAPTTVAGVTATTSAAGGGSLTLAPVAGFVGDVTVKVTATGGASSTSRTFTYRVTDAAPTVAAGSPVVAGSATAPGTLTGTHTAPLTVPLAVTDSDPDSALRTYSVEFSNPLFDIKAQYGLTNASDPANNNSRGSGEKYLQSSNNSNPGVGGNYFAILPDNRLYKFTGTGPNNTFTGTVVQDLAAYGNVYANPALLTAAGQPPATAALNRGPLYDAKTQYGLTAFAGYFNARGANELYFQSTNGSNAANGGYFVLLPNGDLRAFDGSSSATTGTLVANVGTDAYLSPALLTAATPAFVGDALSALKEQYDIGGGGYTPPYQQNARGANEKYLRAGKAPNGYVTLQQVGGGTQVFLGDGVTAGGTLVATLPAAVYANPELLFNSTGQAAAVTAAVTNPTAGGANLVLAPNAAFTGTVRVTVKVSDGAKTGTQTFLYTVTDAAPTQTQIPTQTASSASGSTTVNLANFTSDANGDPLVYAATIADPLADLRVKYGLTAAPNPNNTNARGAQEKYFQSTNGSNPRGGGYFLLLPNGDLRAFDGSSSATTGTLVANVGTAVYADPSKLYNADANVPAALAGVTATVSGSTLTIAWPAGYTGTFKVNLVTGDKALEIQQSFLVTVS